MKIKEYLNRMGNDFWASYQCEFCGAIKGSTVGYDDRYYHENVIPKMVCDKCGLSTAEGKRRGTERRVW